MNVVCCYWFEHLWFNIGHKLKHDNSRYWVKRGKQVSEQVQRKIGLESSSLMKNLMEDSGLQS